MDFKATKPHRNWGPTVRALGVMVLDPKIRSFLEREDPKALEQAIQALEEEGFQPTQGTLRGRP
jgi:hypothetical protein